MAMNIAVITGASSGMGREFVKQMQNDSEIDEMWLIARNEQRLTDTAKVIKKPVRIMPLDLTSTDCLEKYKSELEKIKPNVRALVNCSGYGKFGSYSDISVDVSMNMIDLNVKAYVYMTEVTLQYMTNGARIIQLCSCSAFQPLPYTNIYSSTKAFVLSYTRALNAELKPRQIHALCVTPCWVKTNFIDNAKENAGSEIINFSNISEAKDVVAKAIKDSYNFNRDTSVYGTVTKLQHLSAKLFSHKIAMKIWMKMQKIDRK